MAATAQTWPGYAGRQALQPALPRGAGTRPPDLRGASGGAQLGAGSPLGVGRGSQAQLKLPLWSVCYVSRGFWSSFRFQIMDVPPVKFVPIFRNPENFPDGKPFSSRAPRDLRTDPRTRRPSSAGRAGARWMTVHPLCRPGPGREVTRLSSQSIRGSGLPVGGAGGYTAQQGETMWTGRCTVRCPPGELAEV